MEILLCPTYISAASKLGKCLTRPFSTSPLAPHSLALWFQLGLALPRYLVICYNPISEYRLARVIGPTFNTGMCAKTLRLGLPMSYQRYYPHVVYGYLTLIGPQIVLEPYGKGYLSLPSLSDFRLPTFTFSRAITSYLPKIHLLCCLSKRSERFTADVTRLSIYC